jgi:hypothetical protein
LQTIKEVSMAKSKRTTARKKQPGAPPAQPTSRRAPSEYDRDGNAVESGGKERRDVRSDVSIDEETGAPSRWPGGPGDASFGSDDEGPEGPAR